MSMKNTTDIKQKFEGVYYFRDLLTIDECNDIIEYFDKIESFDAHVQGPALDGDKFYNDSEVNPKTRKGRVKFQRGLEKVPHSFKLVSAMETAAGEMGIILGDTDDHVDFQLAIYDSIGDKFNGHKDQDLSLMSFNKDIRKMSASLQLSRPEEYEGADLWISPDGRTKTSALTPKGSFTVFPSFVLHGIDPLKSGKRLALVLWYKGPAWR